MSHESARVGRRVRPDRRRRSPSVSMVAKLGVVGLIWLAVTMVGSSADAQSDPPPDSAYGDSGVESGVVTVRAGVRYVPTGTGGDASAGRTCTTSSFQVVVDDDFLQPVNRNWRAIPSDGSTPFGETPLDLDTSLAASMRSFSPTGRWFEVVCDATIDILPEGGPPITIAGLMQEAIDQLDPEEPTVAVTPDGLHVTQLHSWLAIEPAYWTLREARVSAGRVWVIGRADPYETIWDPGDGTELVTCAAGTPWTPGLDPENPAHCTHLYQQSSAGAPGDVFELSATVLFQVTAATNAPGVYGPFPDLERTVVQSVEVGEIQAVND